MHISKVTDRVTGRHRGRNKPGSKRDKETDRGPNGPEEEEEMLHHDGQEGTMRSRERLCIGDHIMSYDFAIQTSMCGQSASANS